MKLKYLFIVLLFSSVGVIAQEKQDEFTEKGDLINATLYHDNGIVSQTGFYNKEGNLHGDWISFDNKGLKTAVAKYNNGEKVDTWFFYQDKLISEVTYANSRVSKIKTWEPANVNIVSYR
ncbi:MAG: antitoxin component YwqK of YwqJK toxin-antitoxin module [Flavobacteriaceae bacterium]|jgi:antitoxin component YwqK of YwqJK toxin-antitoxin module